jgi:DNA-binding NtrC family response regulator
MVLLPEAIMILSSFEILVVSSDLVLRGQLADILASLSIDPVVLSTLHECHEILAQKRVGLVFCDDCVADGNYHDLLATCAPTGKLPRVVVASRTVDWDEYNEAMRRGAFDIISVPFRHIDVAWMVIQAKRAEREAQAADSVRAQAPESVKAECVSVGCAQSAHHAC